MSSSIAPASTVGVTSTASYNTTPHNYTVQVSSSSDKDVVTYVVIPCLSLLFGMALFVYVYGVCRKVHFMWKKEKRRRKHVANKTKKKRGKLGKKSASDTLTKVEDLRELSGDESDDNPERPVKETHVRVGRTMVDMLVIGEAESKKRNTGDLFTLTVKTPPGSIPPIHESVDDRRKRRRQERGNTSDSSRDVSTANSTTSKSSKLTAMSKALLFQSRRSNKGKQLDLIQEAEEMDGHPPGVPSSYDQNTREGRRQARQMQLSQRAPLNLVPNTAAPSTARSGMTTACEVRNTDTAQSRVTTTELSRADRTAQAIESRRSVQQRRAEDQRRLQVLREARRSEAERTRGRRSE